MKTNSEGSNSSPFRSNKTRLSESDCQVKLVGKDQKPLVEIVNEIVLSCVKLKEDKNISEEKLNKANKIIEKAEEKRRKPTAQADSKKRALKESTDDGRRTPLP